jgi:hypothetical protein
MAPAAAAWQHLNGTEQNGGEANGPMRTPAAVNRTGLVAAPNVGVAGPPLPVHEQPIWSTFSSWSSSAKDLV